MAFIRAGGETSDAERRARRAGNTPHAEFLRLMGLWYATGAAKGYVAESYGLIETRHYLHNEFAADQQKHYAAPSRVRGMARTRDEHRNPQNYEWPDND